MKRRFSIQLGLASVALAMGVGCGPGFDPASEVKTLRVFGVQKDKPYAKPGDDVTLSLLWDDPKLVPDSAGKPSKRGAQVLWATCENPPNDLYAACFSPLFQVSSDVDNDSTHVVTLPIKLIEGHDPPADASQPSYGILYAFFAVCAGSIVPDPATSSGGLPIACVDADNKKLGPDDFIVGYTAVYAFREREGESIGNRNPLVTGFRVGDSNFPSRSADPNSTICIGAECPSNELAEDIDCKLAENADRCVPACPDDGGGGCPEIRLGPIVDKSSSERDDVSKYYYKRDFTEQMWVNYYVDGGTFASDTRLLNDATRGWNDDYWAKYRAPKTPGTVTLWSVVHDNRGGTEWARVRLGIY